MRSDVKVIIVVAAVVVIVAGVWYIVYHRPNSGRPKPIEQARAYSHEGSTVIDDNTSSGQGSSTDSSFGDTSARRTPPATAPAGDTSLGGIDIPPRFSPPAPPPPAETWYTVQRGDTYRSIAAAKYGNGTMAYVIERANPNVPPSRLAPPLTIKIPPNPTLAGTDTTPTLSRTPTETTVPGSTGVDPISGKKFYTVKKGDNGFSGVAAAVYGNGRDWKLIEDANPGVKSTALRPGQKLWVPDKPATAVRESTTFVDTAHVADRTAPRTPTTAPASPVRVRTGAPVRETLSGGRTFD